MKPAYITSWYESSRQSDTGHVRDDTQFVKNPPSRATDHRGLEIGGWPAGPTKLNSRRAGFHFDVVFDVMISVTPIIFFVLAAFAFHQDGLPVLNDRFEGYLLQAINLSPTIFPIIFAAIMSRTVKNVARFAAEKGSSLGALEALLASQTVVGSIEVLWYLRRVPLISVMLVCFWALSPIGGQGGLRLLYQTDKYSYATSDPKYLDTSPNSIDRSSLVDDDEDTGLVSAAHDLLYAVSLLSEGPALTAVQDTFGNIRIPRLSADQLASTNEEWFEVQNITVPEQYYSMLGVPLAATLSAGTANLTLNATFLSMICQPPQLYNETYSFNGSEPEWRNHLGYMQQSLWDNNITDGLWDPSNASSPSFAMDLLVEQTDQARMQAAVNLPRPVNQTAPRQTLVYSSGQANPEVPGLSQIMITQCSLYSDFVEAFVECENAAAKECGVSKVRPWIGWSDRTNLTLFDDSLIATRMCTDLPLATNDKRLTPRQSSPTEWFLNDASRSFFSIGTSSGVDTQSTPANLLNLTPQQFGDRLALVLNTYWFGSLAPLGLNGNLPPLDAIPTSQEYQANISAWPASQIPFDANETTAYITQSTRIWVCDIAWLSVLVAASCVALLFGLSAIPLRFMTHGPDMLGYVSSLTYANKYVPLETGGTLEGMDRARLLQNVRVRIGDVHGDQEIGHVAFALDDERVAPLSRTKLYM